MTFSMAKISNGCCEKVTIKVNEMQKVTHKRFITLEKMMVDSVQQFNKSQQNIKILTNYISLPVYVIWSAFLKPIPQNEKLIEKWEEYPSVLCSENARSALILFCEKPTPNE